MSPSHHRPHPLPKLAATPSPMLPSPLLREVCAAATAKHRHPVPPPSQPLPAPQRSSTATPHYCRATPSPATPCRESRENGRGRAILDQGEDREMAERWRDQGKGERRWWPVDFICLKFFLAVLFTYRQQKHYFRWRTLKKVRLEK